MYWIDAGFFQLPLQALNVPIAGLDMGAQAGVLAIQVLRMATGAGEACDAVCCTTFGVVLGAGRAAAGLRVAADLSCLREGRGRVSVVCMYVCMYAHIKDVTCHDIGRMITRVPCICRMLVPCDSKRPSSSRSLADAVAAAAAAADADADAGPGGRSLGGGAAAAVDRDAMP